ncbi:MAG: acyl carrier protein [bacterium]
MDLKKIRAEVVAIIADVAEIPEEIITEDALLEDLGVDSLMGLEIVAMAEKRYKIEIPEEQIPKLKTLRHILNMIKKKFLA